MRIAALRGRETFEVEEAPIPSIRPDEVLVRVGVSGVCASDLEPWLIGPPAGEVRYPGHEVSGVVAEVGAEVTAPAVGDRVGVWVTERGFAEYVAVPAAYCFPAGDGPLDEALAEPIACSLNAVEAAGARLGDDVVVIGAGFMGNLVQRLAALRGPRHLIVADTRADALERATRLGATRTVDVTKESLPDVVRSLTDGRGADVTFECTGTQGALTMCGDTTRMSGTIALVGFHQGADRTIPLAYWNWMAFTIVNAHFRDLAVIMRGMSAGMRLLSGGVLSMDGLVSHRFPLEEINTAFATLREKPDGFVKAVVTFPDV
ncbi:zinc-binding dehydrogenase [Microbispora corallina]|uniref:Zn-containing dehydrogenase n=1 Tax=Microbispora corallina TaxID=83302 RepID=A0ABQ4G7V2_9ACTN|nr:zinc-binding dehydrogenase [Microbispora corallina]GIH43131.1 Zn-containing dehydrogenase [Microbispora corallina]